jgi:hypothetical protein
MADDLPSLVGIREHDEWSYHELIKKQPNQALRSSIVGDLEACRNPFVSFVRIKPRSFEAGLSKPSSYIIAIAICKRVTKIGLSIEWR